MTDEVVADSQPDAMCEMVPTRLSDDSTSVGGHLCPRDPSSTEPPSDGDP